MIINMSRFDPSQGGGPRKTGIGIHGIAYDDRSRLAVDLVIERSSHQYCVEYRPDDLDVLVDGGSVQCHDLHSAIETRNAKILIDATTLNAVEMSLIFRFLLDESRSAWRVSYVSPSSYQIKKPERLDQRDFEISTSRRGFLGVPGHVYRLDEAKHRAVFMLGFEGERLSQALEDHAFNPKLCDVVFGVPAFKPGWEMDSYANHVRIIRERELIGRILFCAADNPMVVFETLERLYVAMSPGFRMFVAPLGPKPHAIGVALFLAVRRDVALLFDHPLNAPGAGVGIGDTHLFDIQMAQ